MGARSAVPKFSTVHAATAYVLTHPGQVLVTGWNWKTAFLSAICRAAFWPAGILGHTKVFGPDSVRGFWIEFAFRLVIGGFWGSLLQVFCAARPAWLAGLYLAVLLPCTALLLERLALRMGGAHHVGTITVTSIAFSEVSLLVNLGLMRKGMLLTGRGTSSLVTDLRRIFALITGLGSVGAATQEAHSECVVRVTQEAHSECVVRVKRSSGGSSA